MNNPGYRKLIAYATNAVTSSLEPEDIEKHQQAKNSRTREEMIEALLNEMERTLLFPGQNPGQTQEPQEACRDPSTLEHVQASRA